ncbi:hypothetical protein Si065_01416 [Streptococcus infantarius subsp. infantarius]|nr:hypothetical protein [Streptococcus infantarius subsp. infantarius]
MKTNSVPKIRFKGFTDDWEQRKLEKHIIEYHEVTTENNQYPVLTSSRKGIFLQTDYYSGNQVASADNTGYNIVPYGYFTYRHMSDDEIFHFNINDIVENGIVSTLYPVFTTDEKLDSRYLQYQLNYGSEFARFAVLQKQGGSRTYMYLNKLKKLSLTMPTSIDEQKKISSFLMSLDNLITLHQRKCEQTKELKKFMLQKMFPKKGEKNPEIRFPGFTDDWEQRKAGEIFKSVSDKGYTDLPVLSASQELGMILRDEIGIDIKYDESSIKNYKRVKPGQFVIHLRSFQGGFSWSDIEGITSPAYTILDYQEPEEHCSKFWKIVLTSPMFITRLETVTYGIRDGRSISFTDFSTLNLNVPSIAEQQKIGEYFSKLDNLITLHQRKCEQLKELKKFMLQNMFPKKG